MFTIYVILLTSFTLCSLIAIGTSAYGWRCTIATIHALRKTEGLLTILTNVAGMTLADIAMIAVTMFAALQMTLGIGTLDNEE